MSVGFGKIERMIDHLSDLDAAGLLARASEAVRARRQAEVNDLEVLAQWAAVHSSDPTEGPDGPAARRLGNVLVQVGGDGTPRVQDFCLGEIALARGTGVMSSRHALADVLDLQHRLPLTWAVCLRGECEVWIARRVAKLSRHLDADKVGLVDSAMSRMIATEAAGRVLEVAEAKVIEADPALHEETCEAERGRRFARLGRTNEFGLRMLIARLDAGDAVAVEATVCRVAEIIAPRHAEANPDELRALAFAWLARPAELFALLLEHSNGESQPRSRPRDRSRAGVDGWPPSRVSRRPLGRVARHRPSPSGAEGGASRPPPRGSAGRHRRSGPGRRLRPGHPHPADRAPETVRRAGPAGEGPLRPGPLHRLRAPRDPCATRSTSITGGDYWPYATSTSRNVDLDHPTPYAHGTGAGTGREPPPDQTGSHNSGPLGRRHHRWKTHAGYQSRQCGEGRYIWLTPHGLAFLVDHTGTHRIHPEKARMIFEAPVGVDIYPA